MSLLVAAALVLSTGLAEAESGQTRHAPVPMEARTARPSSAEASGVPAAGSPHAIKGVRSAGQARVSPASKPPTAALERTSPGAKPHCIVLRFELPGGKPELTTAGLRRRAARALKVAWCRKARQAPVHRLGAVRR